jgi:hypothetical protein
VKALVQNAGIGHAHEYAEGGVPSRCAMIRELLDEALAWRSTVRRRAAVLLARANHSRSICEAKDLSVRAKPRKQLSARLV